MSLKIDFLDSHLYFFLKILEPYEISIMKGFTKIHQTLKDAKMPNGQQQSFNYKIVFFIVKLEQSTL